MTDRMQELLGEAIAETEREVFDDAMSAEPDENDGDTSLEDMEDEEGVPSDGDEGDEDADEGEDEPADHEDEQPGDEEAEPEPQRGRGEDRDRRGVPSDRLRQEADARRAAEAERDAERARVRELDARLRLLEQGKKADQPEPEKPDLFADPDKWMADQRAQISREFTERQVNASFADAADEHGEAFGEAFRALTSQNPQDPAARATVQRIWDAPNPGKALMRWHGEQQVLREIGGDPRAYEERIAQRLLEDPDYRRELTQRLSQDARSAGRTRIERQVERGRSELGIEREAPRTERPSGRRLPPSLNSASGGGSHRSRDPGPRTDRGTEMDIFNSAFE